MWIKPVITKGRLQILCRVLINCVRRFNYVIPTKLNQLYKTADTDPAQSIKELCKLLSNLEIDIICPIKKEKNNEL